MNGTNEYLFMTCISKFLWTVNELRPCADETG
jgi:hypothetical protein